MNESNSQIDIGILIRRSLFFLVLVLLTLGNLFVMFRGLNSPQAMDQAQIAREIARGNGATTKFIRPADYYLAEKHAEQAVPLHGFKDSYHAPLNLWVNAAVFKLVGADKPGAYPMGKNQMVFQLDRVIVTVSTVFFLLAIGVNYLLIARIFDAKIAGVCAILMLFSNTFWQFSLSGLPQMLMLFLFSCATYFIYRAIERMHAERPPLMHALLAGVFLTLLALTHWVTVWIALGYMIFAAIAFRPRGVIGVSVLAMVLVVGGIFIARNYQISGEHFGSAFITRANGLGNGSELKSMRQLNAYSPEYDFKTLTQTLMRGVLSQTAQIIPLLAGIIVAPIFFLALLHPFKSPSIGMLRWAILAMWIPAALGLVFFGISDDTVDSNQIHLLFAPLMAAYGIAFVSILWTRLDFVIQIPMVRNAHLIVICGICAAPLVLDMPRKVKRGMEFREKGGVPNWPPYFAPRLRSSDDGLCAWVKEEEVVFSDQPWAVAWYADRVSIWLPPTKQEFLRLETVALDHETPAAGIHISPSSHGEHTLNETLNLYRDFSPLVLNGGVFQSTRDGSESPGTVIHDKAANIKDITATYPYVRDLIGFDMILYSRRKEAVSQP